MRAVGWICLVLATCFLVPDHADARKRRRKRRHAKKVKLVASKRTNVAIERLLKPFKWGMSPEKVMAVIEKSIRKRYAPKLKAASKDPLRYDKLRRELMTAVKKLKKSLVSFEGKRTTWDVSLVDKEFAHKNYESLIVRWGKNDRRFYFFHHQKLWKVFIAFNTDRFRGKTFKDFAAVMIARFGPAEQKYRVTVSGKAEMAYLHWPKSPTTMLRAVDNSGFYGNFSLMLIDYREAAAVNEGRRLNSPKKNYNDPLVDAVTTQDTSTHDVNADVVDQLTGKGTATPSVNDGSGGSTASATPSRPGSTPPPRAHRKKKKLDKNNPLDGLDL